MSGDHIHFQSHAATPPGGLEALTIAAAPPHAVRTSSVGAASVLYPASRYPITTKGAEAFTLQRPISSCVIEARRKACHGLGSIISRIRHPVGAVLWLGECFQFSSPGLHHSAKEGPKGLVGAFHRSSLFISPVSGAFA